MTPGLLLVTCIIWSKEGKTYLIRVFLKLMTELHGLYIFYIAKI